MKGGCPTRAADSAALTLFRVCVNQMSWVLHGFGFSRNLLKAMLISGLNVNISSRAGKHFLMFVTHLADVP